MKKILLIIILVFAGNLQIFSNYVPLTDKQLQKIIGSDTRTIFSLKGEWNKRTLNKTEKVNIPYTEYDITETEYTRTFSLDSNTFFTKNVSLYFLGLAGNVELFINDDFLVKIDGEGLPHNILIPTNLLNVGNNTIRMRFLKMSNYAKKLIRSNIESPKPFIGIFREPLLVISAKTFVKSINQIAEDKQIKINIDIQSVATDIIHAQNQNNESESFRLEWILKKIGTNDQPILNSSVIIQVMRSRITNTSFNFQRNILEEWSPDNPNLYALTIRLRKGDVIVDDYTINIANRTITARGKSIILNGRATKLLCIDYDEFFPGSGYTRTIRSLEEDVSKLKLLGVNAFLFSHTSPSEILLNICEERGMLIMLTHNAPILELNSEESNYANNTLEYKLTKYSNSPAIFAVSSNKQELIKRITNKQFLSFSINDIKNTSNNLEGINFNVYRIDCNINEKNRSELIKKLSDNDIPTLILGMALYKGERLTDAESTLYDRQSVQHKNLFLLYKEANIAGYIVSGLRDILLAYPNYYTFNYDLYKLKKGLIGANNVERPSLNIIKQLYLNEKSSLLNVSDFEIDYSMLYFGLSIILSLIITYTIKRDNKIYAVFQRSLLRGHNLYCDIRDERLYYSKAIYVLLFLEIFGMALVASVYLYFCLYSPTFSYLLSLSLPKTILNFLENIVYSEALLLTFNFAVFLIITLLLMLFLRIIFLIYQVRTSFNKIYYLVVFLYSPLLLLSFLSIFLGRLLILTNITSIIFLILVVLLFILSIKRIIESIAILLDKKILLTSLLVIGSLVVFIVVPLYLYFAQAGTFPFILKLL